MVETVYVATDGSGDYNCDGIDDQVQINEAIAYINGLGSGTVHLKEGTFIFDGLINILSNIIFEGDSQDTTIIKLKTGNNEKNWSHIYGGSGTNNVILQKFTLDGNRAGQSGVGVNDYVQGIYFGYSDDITIQYVTSKNQITDNFYFGVTINSIIKNCIAKDSGHDGFYAGGCDTITFKDGLAWNLGAHGTRFYNTKNSIFEKNELYAGDFGILVETEGSGTYGDNIYRNNYIDNTQFANYAGICIWTESTTTLENETFINNVIATANSYGFYINPLDSSQVVNIKITNNVINDCYHGIYSKSGEVIATNNIITNNRHYGIYGVVLSTYNNVWNNQDGNYGGGASAGIGDISQDPLFMDLENYDFHLESGSPCCGAGENGVDMGAYPCNGVPPPTGTISGNVKDIYDELLNLVLIKLE